jgi:hypothetical protein
VPLICAAMSVAERARRLAQHFHLLLQCRDAFVALQQRGSDIGCLEALRDVLRAIRVPCSALSSVRSQLCGAAL